MSFPPHVRTTYGERCRDPTLSPLGRWRSGEIESSPEPEEPPAKPAHPDQPASPSWLVAAKANAELARSVASELEFARMSASPKTGRGRSPSRGSEPEKSAAAALSPKRVCSRSPLARTKVAYAPSVDKILIPSPPRAQTSPRSRSPRKVSATSDKSDFLLQDVNRTDLVQTAMQSSRPSASPGKVRPTPSASKPLRARRSTSQHSTAKGTSKSRSGSSSGRRHAKHAPSSHSKKRHSPPRKHTSRRSVGSAGVDLSDPDPVRVGLMGPTPRQFTVHHPSHHIREAPRPSISSRSLSSGTLDDEVPHLPQQRLQGFRATGGARGGSYPVNDEHYAVSSDRSESESGSESSGDETERVDVFAETPTRSVRGKQTRGGPDGYHVDNRGTSGYELGPQQLSAPRTQPPPVPPPGRDVVSTATRVFPNGARMTVNLTTSRPPAGLFTDETNSVSDSVNSGLGRPRAVVGSKPVDLRRRTSYASTVSTSSTVDSSKNPGLRIRDLEQQNVALRKLCDAYKASQGSVDQMRAIDQLTQRCNELEAQLTARQTRVPESSAKLRELLRENAELRAGADETSEIKTKLEFALAALKQKEETIEGLERQVQTLRAEGIATTPSGRVVEPTPDASAKLQETVARFTTTVQRTAGDKPHDPAPTQLDSLQSAYFAMQRRLSDQRALLEEETVLRKRAEGKCVEIRVKCKSLETELESANHALSESAKTIQDQMDSLNGLKDELLRLRRFKAKIMAQTDALGSPKVDSEVSPSASVGDKPAQALAQKSPKASSTPRTGGSSGRASRPTFRSDSGASFVQPMKDIRPRPSDVSDTQSSAKQESETSNSRRNTADTVTTSDSDVHPFTTAAVNPQQSRGVAVTKAKSPLAVAIPPSPTSSTTSDTSKSNGGVEEKKETDSDGGTLTTDDGTQSSPGVESMGTYTYTTDDTNPALARRDSGASNQSSEVANVGSWGLGTSHAPELKELYAKYADGDGAGLLQFTQLSEAAKLVPINCSNHDVFQIFKSVASPSDIQPYSKILKEAEWTLAVRKLANWCYSRYKCDDEFRLRDPRLCAQAMDALFKRLLATEMQ